MTSKENVKIGDIAARAYQIWENSGHPNGSELKHWLQAEQELSATGASKVSTTLAKPAQKPEGSKKEPSKPQPRERAGASAPESSGGPRQRHAIAA